MKRFNVNPTRTELKLLKRRLGIAVRGHKILKDKTEQMIHRFTALIKKDYRLREKVEAEFRDLLSQFIVAKAFMRNDEVISTFLLQKLSLPLKFEDKLIMNVPVPKIDIMPEALVSNLPYSFIGTNAQFDVISPKVVAILPKLLELATLEKTCQILALDIEKFKRRVNALEYNMIPDLKETIKYITLKIEEDERSSEVIMMKVKSFLKKD